MNFTHVSYLIHLLYQYSLIKMVTLFNIGAFLDLSVLQPLIWPSMYLNRMFKSKRLPYIICISNLESLAPPLCRLINCCFLIKSRPISSQISERRSCISSFLVSTTWPKLRQKQIEEISFGWEEHVALLVYWERASPMSLQCQWPCIMYTQFNTIAVPSQFLIN